MFTDQQVEDGIAAIMDRAQNKAVVVRAVLSMMHTNQAALAARARGNQIHYTSGQPTDALGMEGDLGVDKDNGDFFYFAGGTFNFLFNGAGKIGSFEPIAQNTYGTHPAFTTQRQLDIWLLQHGGGSVVTPTPTTPAAPVVVYNSTTRQLTASHSLGGTIQFSYKGSAFVDYIGALQVDDSAHVAGDWQFKRLASTGYNESPSAASPAIAPKPVAAAPTITSFTPTSGAPGSQFVLTGTNFTNASQVSINSAVVASFVVNSATQITTTLTASNVTGLVRVTTPGGTATSSTAFTVSAPSTSFSDLQIDANRLTSFVPASGTGPAAYEYQFTPQGGTASGYSALPMPTVAGGRVRFTLTGNSAGTLQVRRTSQPNSPLSVAVATYAGKLLSYNAEGDSLSANAARNGSTWSWFNQLQTALAADPTFIGFNNYATGGNALSEMVDAANKSEVLAGYNANSGVINILSLLAGINDFQFGKNPQQVYRLLKQLVKYYVAAGYSVVVYTITTSRLVNASYDHMQFWLKVQELNERVKAGFNSGDIPATVLLDLQTNPHLGGYDAPLNPTYFVSDQIHYTEAAASIIRDFILRAIPYLRAGTRMHLTETQDLVATPAYAPAGTPIRELDYAYYTIDADAEEWGSYAGGPTFKAPTVLQCGDPVTRPVYVRFESDGTNVIKYIAPRYGVASARMDLLLDGNPLTTINFASGGGHNPFRCSTPVVLFQQASTS